MFKGAISFNKKHIESWCVDNVENMIEMLCEDTSQSQSVHLSDEEGTEKVKIVNDNTKNEEGTEKVKVVNENTKNENTKNEEVQEINLNQWNVENVKYMKGLFRDSPYNFKISNWNTSNVESMDYMFKNALNFDEDLSSWNTSNVKTMSGMFYNAEKFNNYGKDLKTIELERGKC